MSQTKPSTNKPATQTRFLRRGISEIYWLKKVNNPEQPSRTELSEPNRFDLTKAVSDIEGWALENEPIETPTWARRSTPRSRATTRPTAAP